MRALNKVKVMKKNENVRSHILHGMKEQMVGNTIQREIKMQAIECMEMMHWIRFGKSLASQSYK